MTRFGHVDVVRGLRFGSVSYRAQQNAITTRALRRHFSGAERRLAQETEEYTFGSTDRAKRASQIDLSAKLRSRKEVPPRGEITRLLQLAKPESKSLGFAFVLLCVSSGIAMSVPYTIGRILDVATEGEEETGERRVFGLTLNQFYVALGAVLATGSVCNFGRIIILRVVGERTVSKLRSRLFQHTVHQDASFFDSNRHGELISRLSNDTTIATKAVTQNLSDGLRAIVSGVAGLGMMVYVSPSLTGVMMLLIPPVGIMGIVYGRFIKDLSRKQQKALGELTKVSEERLGAIRTTQAFSGEILEVRRYNAKIRDLFQLGYKEAKAQAMFFSVSGLSGNITIIVLLALGGQMVGRGTISIGDLSSFLLYTIYAGSSISGLSSFYSELMKGVGAASRIFELLDRQPSIPSTRGLAVRNARGVVRFRNVTFAYPTRPLVNIFNGLDFEIPQGMNVCIVGPSGGGKSTVSALLLRYYDPTNADGEVTLNGVNIKKFNLKQYRRQISVVSQEPVLFSGTLAENIAYGKPNATRRDIIEAARTANCDFIADFPDGLETQVGSRGAQLSGGQKQRIAIARALIRRPAILILDEATSALDANSEYLVNDALGRLMQLDSTTITIAHRLATIRRADRIIVLNENGKVAEIGSYEELSNTDGAFSQLMKMQFDKHSPNPQKPVQQNEADPPVKEDEDEEEAASSDPEEEDVSTSATSSPLRHL